MYKLKDFHKQKLLLDTNVLIYQLSGQIDLTDYLLRTEKIFVSAITISELYAGVQAEDLQAVKDLLDEFEVVPVTDKIAGLAGGFKSALGGKSEGIGLKDLIIAASSQIHDLRLVTANRADFEGLLTKTPIWVEID